MKESVPHGAENPMAEGKVESGAMWCLTKRFEEDYVTPPMTKRLS